MPIIVFDKIVQETEKARLINVNEYVTWISKKFSKIVSDDRIYVADWLHPKLIWSWNFDDIDLVVSWQEFYEHEMRRQLSFLEMKEG